MIMPERLNMYMHPIQKTKEVYLARTGRFATIAHGSMTSHQNHQQRCYAHDAVRLTCARQHRSGRPCIPSCAYQRLDSPLCSCRAGMHGPQSSFEPSMVNMTSSLAGNMVPRREKTYTRRSDDKQEQIQTDTCFLI